MTTDNEKSCLGYSNNSVDECNNTYHYSIGKRPVDADYSALTGEKETNPKLPNFKGDRVRIT